MRPPSPAQLVRAERRVRLPAGFTTFSSLPTFPNIGGAPEVTGFDSPNCGTCWNLTFTPTGQTITVTAIDVATAGVNIALEAMNTLTGGRAVDLGRVNATVVEVDKTLRGFNSTSS